MTDEIKDIWLTTQEAAALAGVDERSIRRHVAAGKITARPAKGRGGKQYQILLSSLSGGGQSGYWQEQSQRAETKSAEILRDKGIPTDAAITHRRKPLSDSQSAALWHWYARTPDSVKRRAEERHDIMLEFSALEETGMRPGVIVRQLCAKHGASHQTINRMRRLITGQSPTDWLPLLAPHWKGGTHTAEFSDDAWHYIRESWLQQSRPKLKPIVDRARRLGKKKGWIIPSIDAVRGRIDAIPRTTRVLRRDGSKALNAMYPAPPRDTTTVEVHEEWCSDGHKADVFCRFRNADGSEIVARPIVVGWQDIRTRYLVGYAVDRTESADLIRLSLRRACQSAKAIPRRVLFDNGRGYASKLMTGGVSNRFRFKIKDDDVLGILPRMGIGVHWAEPGNGQSKPIERTWQFIAEMCRRPEFKGAYCGSSPDQKPEEFNPKKAVSIELFLAILADEVAAYNSRAHRGHGMGGRSPYDVLGELLQSTAVPIQRMTNCGGAY